VPDLVITFTKPPEERPNSALAPPATTTSFPDRVEVEREGWPLSTALLAEEGVVEVRPVHGHVVVNAALARHGELVAIRALHDRHIGGEQREVDEVAPVVRQTRYSRGGEGVAAADCVTFTTGCVASTVTAARVTAASGSRRATVSPTPSAIPVRFTSA